jgi:predicted secreted protein
VGGPAGRSRSPAPTVEQLVSRMTQRSTKVVESQAPAVDSRPEPSTTAGAEEPALAQAEEEAPAEAGLVDIASILGAPTVTALRSNLYVKTFPD